MTKKDNEVKIPQANFSIRDSLKPSNKETIMVEQITSKKCSICQQIKPVSEFYKRSDSKDRFFSQCKICRCLAVKRYKESEKGRATQKRYRESEKGRATRKFYVQSEKGKSAQRKSHRRQRLSKITKCKRAPNLHIERTRTPPNWAELGKDWNPCKTDTLTSRQWRAVIEFVENEAKDREPTFFRRQKTDELIVSIMMLDVSCQRLINLNIEDMSCSHREPHIIVRNPSTGEIREVFIDRALETKIKAYYNEFRQDANENDPFLATRSGKRLDSGAIYSKLNGFGQKGKSNYHAGIAGKLGLDNLNLGIFKRTLKEREGRYNSEKKSKSKERQWRNDNRSQYITATDAIKFAQNNNRKLTPSQLTKILKPDGPMRYMRKEMRKTGRCKVHIGDFIEYAETLPYIKPKGEQIPDERVDEFLADQDATKAEIREQK